MTVYAFTSVALNYLPKARVLARSVRQLHPGMRFVVVLAEPAPEGFSGTPDYFDEVMTLPELGVPSEPAWLFQHNLVEACTALKGFVLENLLQRRDCEAVLYFDPDIVLFHPVDGVLDLLREHSIILTPHQLDPESASDAVLDNEMCSLRHGVYNLGFLAVRNSDSGRHFSRWWRERLERHCFDDVPKGLFTDQRWADLVPALFEGVHILRDRSYNVATWNIGFRRIEGTIDAGMLAGGKPLRFFHFSGFDSGAQLMMLRGYGGSMPAAFALRAWYINRCAEIDIEGYASREWQYDRFSNGEPITAAQRTAYRDRPDLQQAFPDPFRVEPGEACFRQWYARAVESREIAAGEAGEVGDRAVRSASPHVLENPLAHFLVEGAKSGLNPHPLFDTRHYLETNPEVRVGQMNPLVHYVTEGEAAGRDPHPNFSVPFYRQERPDAASSAHGVLAHYCSTGKEAGARPHPRFNAVRDSDLLAVTARRLDNGKPTLVYVTSGVDSDVRRHVGDLFERFRQVANLVVLEPCLTGSVTVDIMVSSGGESGAGSPVRFEFDSGARVHELVNALRMFRPARFHIHHLHGHDRYLRPLLAALGTPFDFTVHDYYVFSPEPHFAGAGGHFVGDIPSDRERELFEYGIGKGAQNLAAWRALHLWIINGADRVIVPSRDVEQRLRNFGVRRPLVFAPHPGTPYRCNRVAARPVRVDRPLRVAVLGELALHNGLLLLQDCALAAAHHRAAIEYHVIGALAEGIRRTALEKLDIHETHVQSELEEMVRAVDPDVAWFPATSLEAFSYSLSTALSLELPVAATDLGPFPERLEHRPLTWILPWHSSSARWLETFTDIRRILAGNVAPPPRPSADAGDSRTPSSFYDHDYLSPAASALGGERSAPAPHRLAAPRPR